MELSDYQPIPTRGLRGFRNIGGLKGAPTLDELRAVIAGDLRRLAPPNPRVMLAQLRADWLAFRYRVRWLRPLADAEKAEQAAMRREAKRIKAQRAQLRKEAREFQRRIVDRLNRLGIAHFYKKSEQDMFRPRIQPVKFSHTILTEDECWLRVDTLRMPWGGVSTSQIEEPDVLRELTFATGHQVRTRFKVGRGFFIIVERKHGVGGIPRHVNYDDMIERMPVTADALAIPFGVTHNKRRVYKSLSNMLSLLIAGEPGGGKSNLINVIICTLIQRNRPRRLQLALVDLKGGVEFAFYKQLPHLLQLELPGDRDASADDWERRPAIIKHRQQVKPLLDWLLREGERRLDRLEKSGVKKISEYNFKHRGRNAMSEIVLVVDEWADIKLLPTRQARASEEALINIAQRFRAVGIHVVLCTQVPNKDVLNMRLKGSMPSKIAFSCSNMHTSILIVGDASAEGLSPEGRCILAWHGPNIETQVPLITNERIDSIVRAVRHGESVQVDASKHDVTDQEILEWALEEQGGHLSNRAIFNHFRSRGLTQKEAWTITAAYEGQQVVVGGAIYEVIPSAGRWPRRMVAVAAETPDESAENSNSDGTETVVNVADDIAAEPASVDISG